jgi:hypothetical protein
MFAAISRKVTVARQKNRREHGTTPGEFGYEAST